MKFSLVDSSGWMEYFAGSDRAELFAAAIENSQYLIVSAISIYEVFKKFLRECDEKQAITAAGAMMSGTVIDVDTPLLLDAARHKLPLADSIIYETALRHNAILWTQDIDFADFSDVKYFPKPQTPAN